MIVTIPHSLEGAGLGTFLAAVVRPNGEVTSASFQFDLRRLRFISPVGVVTLANVVEYARTRGCRVDFSNCDPQAASVAYLDDCGFFNLYAGAPLRPSACRRSTTAPFQRVSHVDSHHWLETSFGRWLAGCLNLPAPAVATVQTGMKEIFNNIQDHSTLQIGCTHMQHFPNKNEVQIAVSDFGIGIPETIRRKFPSLNDAAAIHHASQLGVTAGTARNRGVGLDHLINVVVGMNKGQVRITSGHGELACRMDGKSHIREPRANRAFYPGTMLSIRLDATTFQPDDAEEEDLQW